MTILPSKDDFTGALVTESQFKTAMEALIDRLNELLDAATNIDDYGAVGDYSTDDTAAYDLAMAAIITRGGGIITATPGKKYKLGNTKMVSINSATNGGHASYCPGIIVADFRGVTFGHIDAGANTRDMFSFHGAPGTDVSVSWVGGTLVGNANSLSLIKIRDGSRFTILPERTEVNGTRVFSGVADTYYAAGVRLEAYYQWSENVTCAPYQQVVNTGANSIVLMAAQDTFEYEALVNNGSTISISAVAWAAGTITATCNDTSSLVSGGKAFVYGLMLGPGLNGLKTVTVTSPTSFTFPFANNPGTITDQAGVAYWSAAETAYESHARFRMSNVFVKGSAGGVNGQIINFHNARPYHGWINQIGGNIGNNSQSLIYSSNTDELTDLSIEGVKLEAATDPGATISAASWSGGVVTLTVNSTENLATGKGAIVEGLAPSTLNVVDVVITVVNATTATYPLATDPGAITGQIGTITSLNTYIFGQPFLAAGEKAVSVRNCTWLNYGQPMDPATLAASREYFPCPVETAKHVAVGRPVYGVAAHPVDVKSPGGFPLLTGEINIGAGATAIMVPVADIDQENRVYDIIVNRGATGTAYCAYLYFSRGVATTANLVQLASSSVTLAIDGQGNLTATNSGGGTITVQWAMVPRLTSSGSLP